MGKEERREGRRRDTGDREGEKEGRWRRKRDETGKVGGRDQSKCSDYMLALFLK